MNFASFIKPSIYGMICMILLTILIGWLVNRPVVIWGALLGGTAGLFNIWSYYEQGRGLFDNPHKNNAKQAYWLRMAINGVCMAIAAYIALEMLFVTFLCIYAVRWILFFSIRHM